MKLRTASVMGAWSPGRGRQVARQGPRPPAELEQLLRSDQRVQPGRLSARERRREDRRAVGPREVDGTRARRLDRAEPVAIRPEPEDAEHAQLATGRLDEASVH